MIALQDAAYAAGFLEGAVAARGAAFDVLRRSEVSEELFAAVAAATYAVIRSAASGTEAGTGETEGLDPKGNGPTLEERDAKTPSPSSRERK